MHGSIEFALLSFAVATLLLYFIVNRGHARYYFETAFDRAIPFLPAFIVPYLAFLPLLAFSLFALYPEPAAFPYFAALTLCALVTTFVRFVVHSGIRQPRVRKRDVFDTLVRWLYRHDDRAHTFPSEHVFASIITAYFLSAAFPECASLIWAVALLICLSTLFVKQHYLVDVLGGAAFAAVSIALALTIVPVV